MATKQRHIYLAIMDTEHYTWRAIGHTAKEAKQTIANEWANGKANEYRDPMTLEELEDYYGINVYPMVYGECDWN